MGQDITPVNVRGIQIADHETVADMNDIVIETTRSLQQSNRELELLDDSLRDLSYTLDVNEELKGKVRQQMQKTITRL